MLLLSLALQRGNLTGKEMIMMHLQELLRLGILLNVDAKQQAEIMHFLKKFQVLIMLVTPLQKFLKMEVSILQNILEQVVLFRKELLQHNFYMK